MLVAGNWKMYKDLAGARALASGVAEAAGAETAVKVALCPPAAFLLPVAEAVAGTHVRVGAQNMHAADEGAFTGELAAAMLTSVGCTYVILGHSERRQYFHETDEGVGEKVAKAMAKGLVPILCVGETLEEREAGQAEAVVARQLTGGLATVTLSDAAALVVAYEPVWAIGTGKTASPADAQAMHAMIRTWMGERFGEVGRGVELLYGGSVKPGNAAELFGQPDIDGGLIGGASLTVADFVAIVQAAR